MKIAALQLDIVWEDPTANFERASPWIRSAVGAGARLVLLPEMFAYGFSMNAAAIEEPEDGASEQFLRQQATLHRVWVGGTVPQRRHAHNRPANTFVLVAPDGQVHRYRKIHPFSFAHEHEHYEAGDRHVTVEIDGVRCTLFVCYDLRFADEFWVTAPTTDCYLVVANWPERRRRHFQILLAARAIENQAWVVAVNRVGTGNGVTYAGDSCIVDPWGESRASAAAGETMVLAEVDRKTVDDARREFPVMVDRRQLFDWER